jgi:hypothetical protein
MGSVVATDRSQQLIRRGLTEDRRANVALVTTASTIKNTAAPALFHG